jgi:hypothetical protein
MNQVSSRRHAIDLALRPRAVKQLDEPRRPAALGRGLVEKERFVDDPEEFANIDRLR